MCNAFVKPVYLRLNLNKPYNPLEGKRPELNLDLHDGIEEMITIVIVHRNTPNYLNLLLQSIAIASINNNYEIIVVDNGSDQESQEVLDEIESLDIKVIRNKENRWWGPAANQGAAAANKNSKYIVFMHSDVVILNPVWLDTLINVSEAQNSGLVGTEMQSYYMSGAAQNFIEEWCMLMTRECWEDIGPFPEELPQVGHSFVLTIKAQQYGYNPLAISKGMVHHYRIFALDINQFERIVEKAMVEIPQQIKKVQNKLAGAAR